MSTVAVLYIDPRGPYPRFNNREFAQRSRAISGLPNTWDGLRVDCWDATRDARRYDGPYPVVAHPPCRHWSRLRHMAHVECSQPGCTWRGRLGETAAYETQRCPSCFWPVTSDADCAPRAVEQVRRWGGVLEHPAGSKLWEHCGLPVPLRCICCAQEGDCRLKPHTNCGRPARYIMCDGWPDSLPLCVECQPLAEFTVSPACGDPWGGYTIEVDQVEWGHVARKRTWLYLVGVPREALEQPPFPGREATHFRRLDRTPSLARRRGGKHCSRAQWKRTPPRFAEYLIRLARAVKR